MKPSLLNTLTVLFVLNNVVKEKDFKKFPAAVNKLIDTVKVCVFI